MKKTPFRFSELLVVIFCLLVLGTLLVPAIEAARVDAESTLCLSRKQQAMMAQATYAGDYEGFFIIDKTPASGDLNAHSWVAVLCNAEYQNTGRYTVEGKGKYLKFADAQCPLATPYLPKSRNYHIQVYGIDATMGNPRPLLGTWFVQQKGFRGMNTKGMKKISEIPVYADTIRLDGNYNNTKTPYWMFTLYGGLAQNREIKVPLGGVYEAHEGNKSAVAYADGHAELVSGQEMYDSPYRLRTWVTGTTSDTLVYK